MKSDVYPGRILFRWTILLFMGLNSLACAGSVFYQETTRIRGFDPIRVSDIPSVAAVTKVYEPLYQCAYLDRPYRVEPLLAARMPEFSPDGLTCTITLRSGIHYSDDPCFRATGGRGREVTANDFEYAFKRIADAANRSPGFGFFRGRIIGLDAFRERSQSSPANLYDTSVEGIQVLDATTLVVRLTRPWPQFPWILSLHYLSAVPREAVEMYGADLVRHPVGTGPYILAEWQPNYRMVFDRHPAWAKRTDRYPSAGGPGDRERGLLRDAGKQLPMTDRIVQQVIGDPSTQWLMFLKGLLDTSGISRDQWDAVVASDGTLKKDAQSRGWRLHLTPALDTYYIGFNMDDPLLGTNQFLRQALTCAFNRGEWQKFYGSRIIPAVGPVPPGVAGYRDGASPFAFDLGRAAHLLKEAGYPDGRDPATGRRLHLTLELGSTEPETREAVELLVDFMARIGIVVEPAYYNKPVFFSRVERREAQMFWLNWTADYPDAENFLQLFYGPNASPGTNRSNYRNADFDRLYEAAASMPLGEARDKALSEMAAMVMNDCPWLFLHHPVAVSLTHPWVSNLKPHDFPGGVIKYYRVDEKMLRATRGGG